MESKTPLNGPKLGHIFLEARRSNFHELTSMRFREGKDDIFRFLYLEPKP